MCSKEACNAGKHPRTEHGVHFASSDQATVREWWRRWPTANIGVACGDGLVVIDIDSDEAYQQALRLGLPETAEVLTGRGRHLYYRGAAETHDGPHGIEIKGRGTYVVAPPSRHVSGNGYRWLRPFELATLAELPAWATEQARSDTDRPADGRPDGDRCLVEGARHTGLLSLAGTLRSVGLDADEIEGALVMANINRCDVPLGDEEVQSIAVSVGRYPPGRLIDKTLLAMELGPHAVAVYLALRTMSDARGQCYPSLETIAALSGVGRTTAHASLKKLRQHRLIAITRRADTSNLYTLLDPQDTSTVPAPAADKPKGQNSHETR